MTEEMYWTCDWLGCGSAVSVGADESEKWGKGSFAPSCEEDVESIDFDLCPEHVEQLDKLLDTPREAEEPE